PQEQISKSDYEQAIRDKYLNRRGYGFDLSPDDEVALQEIMNERIPLSTVLRGIDKAFDDFKPKHSRDSIRSLKYCIPIIFDLHYAATAREKANRLLKQGGRTVHEASYQPSPEPYT